MSEMEIMALVEMCIIFVFIGIIFYLNDENRYQKHLNNILKETIRNLKNKNKK